MHGDCTDMAGLFERRGIPRGLVYTAVADGEKFSPIGPAEGLATNSLKLHRKTAEAAPNRARGSGRLHGLAARPAGGSPRFGLT